MAPISGGGTAAGRPEQWHVHPPENARSSASFEGPPRRAGDTGYPPELDCVRHLLPKVALAWAARRAERLGIGADRALIAARLIDEETYVRALGNHLGIAFEPLDGVPRAHCPLDDKALLDKAATGLLPLSDGKGASIAIAVAPSGTAARGLIRLVGNEPANAARFRLTTTERVNRFIMRTGRDVLVAAATRDLKDRWPVLSARSRYRGRGIISIAAIAALASTAATLAPVAALTTLELLLSAVFLAWLALRLTGAFLSERIAVPDRRLPDRTLPVYTVIAALYREAASVAGLLTAIERLDYPGLMYQMHQNRRGRFGGHQ